MRDDRGSASIWVLAASLVVLAFGYTVTTRGVAVVARHRANAAADLAALAAAARIGVGGDPCASARSIAEANHAALTMCQAAVDPDGRAGTVAVTVTAEFDVPIVGARSVVSSARAARIPAS